MATSKRERQRANRELRQAETKKQQSRSDLLAKAKRWTKIGLLIVVIFIGSNLIIGNCGDEPTNTTTTTLVEITEEP